LEAEAATTTDITAAAATASGINGTKKCASVGWFGARQFCSTKEFPFSMKRFSFVCLFVLF